MIRPARPDDAAAIAAVHRAAFFEAMPWMPRLHTPEEDVAFFGRAIEEDEVLVGEVDGEPAAFAAIGAAMLDHLYVHPRFQGRGLGSALLAEAKARRPDGLTLWAFQRNEQARRFYEARGFRPVRETDGRDNEEKQPDVLYAWP